MKFRLFISLMMILMQGALFANTTYVNKLFYNNNSSLNLYEYLPDFFKKNINNNTYNNGASIAVESEVVDGICFNNITEKKIKYSIKNISNSNIVLNDSDAGRFRIQLSGSGFNFDSVLGVSLSSYKYIEGKITILPGESLDFTLSFNESSNDVFKSTLKIVYGTALTFETVNILSSNKIQEFNVENNLYKSNTTTLPELSSGKLNPYGSNTLQNSLGLTNQEISSLTFYKDGQVINANTIIDYNNSTGFKYSTQCSGNVRGDIKFTLLNIADLPLPGTISTVNNMICFGGSATITNVTSGQGTYLTSLNISRYALKYSWEISYDNGVSWVASDDSQDVDGFQTITINNITTNILVRRKAHERPVGTRKINFSYTTPVSISVIKNNIIFPNGISNTVAFKLNSQSNSATASLPVLTASIPGSTIEYRDKSGNLIATNPTSPVSLGNLPLGEHLYEVKAKNTISGNIVCETIEKIKVLIYDPATCSNYTKKTLGTIVKGWTSGLSGYRELANVTDGNRASYGELNGGVVLLGIGTVGMDIYFTKPNGTLYTGAELKGKKVVIKLGEQYSGLKVAGGLSVIGRLTDNGVTAETVGLVNASNVGAAFGVKGGVLDALKGDNVFEFSFTPANSIGSNANNIDYNGVRIQLGSLIGVADLATVFYAYIEEESNLDTDFGSNRQTYCDAVNGEIRVTPPSGMAYPTLQDDIESSMPKLGPITNTNFKLNRSVEDAFWGNYTEVLNVASSLNSVVYPYYAVDDDYDSYSIFNTVVGVLNSKFLQAKLRQKARIGDQVQITLSYPNISILNLSLLQLGNFKIVFYLNGAKVGEELLEEFRVLDIGLFRFRDKRRAILSKPVNFMFDKIELNEFSAVDVNLGTSLRIHDIRINPLNAFAGMTDPKQVTQLCATAPVVIQKMDPCTEYELSFARVTEFGPEYLVNGTTPLLDYKGQPIRSIYSVQDIPNSNLTFQREDATGSLAYYAHNRTTLFTGPDYDGKLLIKIKTKRQGCDFGEPQYLRVNLENCIQGSINPVIMNNAKY